MAWKNLWNLCKTPRLGSMSLRGESSSASSNGGSQSRPRCASHGETVPWGQYPTGLLAAGGQSPVHAAHLMYGHVLLVIAREKFDHVTVPCARLFVPGGHCPNHSSIDRSGGQSPDHDLIQDSN